MPITRSIRNVVHNYTESQIKVRESTSNDPWGPSSTLMAEIADLTYNNLAFAEIMQMIWKRLNDHGKNWRHVYKSLVLLDYIIKTGSEKIAQQCKENIFAIQTLKDFQYVEDNKDHGMNVREKAKMLVSLLQDDERLKNERAKALKAKERLAQNFVGISSTGSTTSHPSTTNISGSNYKAEISRETENTETPTKTDLDCARPSTAGEEELQLQLAIAMSKEEADEAEKRRRGDEVKFQLALEESQKSASTDQPSLLDMASSGGTSKNIISDNTWDIPALQPPPSSANNNPPTSSRLTEPVPDPWNPLLNNTSNTAPAPDPWSPPTSNVQTNKSDPWTSNAPTSVLESPWQPSSDNNPVPHSVDDAFDLIGSRPSGIKSASKFSNGSQEDKETFDLTQLADTMPPSDTIELKKSKSPADFLGNHASLVNLDNLVTKPAQANPNNPFALTNPGVTNTPPVNPFGNQNSAPRIPMNEMVSNQTSGFLQPQTLQTPYPPPGQNQAMQQGTLYPISSNINQQQALSMSQQPLTMQQQQGKNPFM